MLEQRQRHQLKQGSFPSGWPVAQLLSVWLVL